MIICTTDGSIHRVQRWRKNSSTLNNTTHPQTPAIILQARSRACTGPMGLVWEMRQAWGFPGRIAPTHKALAMWIPHRSHASHHRLNCAATIPNRNAGPQLLQNASILWASSLCRLPFSAAWLMHWAPTGYPPNRPASRMDSAPSGMWHRRHTGLRTQILLPIKDAVSRIDRKKKGSREGITVRTHKSIPLRAPATAVLVSSISSPIPTAAAMPQIDFLLPSMSTTSEDPMHQRSDPSRSVHKISTKEVLP